MSKVIPTTKSCSQICYLLTGCSGSAYYGKYVDTTLDPKATHALYGVNDDEVDFYKEKIKSIGGKYIRVVGRDSKYRRIIHFRLTITPQEELEVKMALEKQKRYQQAYESKLEEINMSILLMNAGATDEVGKKNFASYLLNGDLDPLLPFESYVFIDDPKDKDERRIYDIIRKANVDHPGCVGMVTTAKWEMIELAKRMNKSITDEDKRARRHAACLKYGLNFLAKYFTKIG